MKPSIYTVAPFDVNLGTKINIKWDSTNRQQKANKIEVYESVSGTKVYEATYASYKGVHVIPGTPATTGLENGKIYNFKIAVIDMDDVVSDWSDQSTFMCFTTPQVGFIGITNGYVFTGSSIELPISYTQAEGEQLNKWYGYLYDSTKNQIDVSAEKLYSSDSIGGTTCKFYGLSDQTSYYVRAIGTTVNGMAIDSGYILINIELTYTTNFLNFEASNNSVGGNIKLVSKAVSITGVAEKEPEYFTENDLSFIDLRDNSVKLNEGFKLNKNFTTYLRFKQAISGKPIIQMKSPDGNDLISACFNQELVSGSNYKFYATLTATTTNEEITVNSNILYDSLQSNDAYLNGSWLLDGEVLLRTNSSFVKNEYMYGMVIQRQNNEYSISIAKIS